MLNFLFWNVRRQNLETQIQRLATIHEVDIIALAEFDAINSKDRLLEYLNRAGKYEHVPSVPTKIELFVRFPHSWMHPVADDDIRSNR